MFKKFLFLVSVFLLVFALCAGVTYADTCKIAVVAADALNLRESPNTSAKLLTQLSKDDQVSMIDSSNGWYKVQYGNIIGWVCGQYVTVKEGNIPATIVGDDVNVRTSPSLTADVITKVSSGYKVNIVVRSDEWFNVELSNGTKGWINKQFIAIGSSKVSRGGSMGEQIVTFAKKYQGVGYIWGGSSPKGFDCSGFVKYVFDKFDIELNRVAADQVKQGEKVGKSSLQLGDIVFFDTDGGGNYINHVGIYIGDGDFIHASSGKDRVTINTLSDGFYANCYITARRVIR